MSSLVNKISLSQQEKLFFEEHGFIKLNNLFSREAIDRLRQLTLNSNYMKRPPESYSGEVSRLGYDLEGEILYEICSSTSFKGTLQRLTEHQLTCMQGIAFEIKTGQQGFNWHHDLYSFCYIRPEDLGYTLWIPLDPIHIGSQHGGLAYTSQTFFSAREYFNLMYQLVQHQSFSRICQSENLKSINFQYASKLEELVLEEYKIEDNFEIGDAVLLDKLTWHRSCPLKRGDLSSRTAYVMRFIDSQSRYSKVFLEGTYSLLEFTGNDLQTNFGYQLASLLKDGDLIPEDLMLNKI